MKAHLQFPPPDSAPQARIASGRDELARACELVYRAYVAKGYTAPNAAGVVCKPVPGLPSTRTIVALAQSGDMAGTLTLVGDNSLGLQMEATCAAEVQALRGQGRSLTEVTCPAVEAAGRYAQPPKEWESWLGRTPRNRSSC